MSKTELDAAEKRVQEAIGRLQQVLDAKIRQIEMLQQQLTATTTQQSRQLADIQTLVSERDSWRDRAALLELDQARLPLGESTVSVAKPVDTEPLYAEIARLEAENRQLRLSARDAARRVVETIGRLRLAAQG